MSNRTISLRIDNMAEHISVQVLLLLKGKNVALQLDKVTDSNKD